MKIAVIADVLGEENNGTSITVKRLIDNLKARGHEVFVVSPKSSVPRGEGYYEVEKIDFKIFNGYVAKNGVELAKPNLELLEKVIRPVDVVHALMPFPLGRAAVRAMCALAFSQTDAVRIHADVFCANAASVRLLEKCGFSREGVFARAAFKNGVFHDVARYALLKERCASRE